MACALFFIGNANTAHITEWEMGGRIGCAMVSDGAGERMNGVAAAMIAGFGNVRGESAGCRIWLLRYDIASRSRSKPGSDHHVGKKRRDGNQCDANQKRNILFH